MLVLQLQSRGFRLTLRSCLVVPVVKEPMKSHHQGQLHLEEELCSLPKQLLFASLPDALCREWPAQPCSAVQPIFFSLSFSLRLQIPASHFLSVDTDAPKSRILFHSLYCLAWSPINAANTRAADSIQWPFVLTFQPLTNWNGPYLLAAVPEAFLLTGFFFQLPTSMQRFPKEQQVSSSAAEEWSQGESKNTADTEQYPFLYIINILGYWCSD